MIGGGGGGWGGGGGGVPEIEIFKALVFVIGRKKSKLLFFDFRFFFIY